MSNLDRVVVESDATGPVLCRHVPVLIEDEAVRGPVPIKLRVKRAVVDRVTIPANHLLPHAVLPNLNEADRRICRELNMQHNIAPLARSYTGEVPPSPGHVKL